MTEKIIALVDYENIGTLESVRLSRYERLILFTGPQQEFIRFPAVTYAGDISISVFQVANVSKIMWTSIWCLSWEDLARLRRKRRYSILSRMIKAMMASLPGYAGRGDDVAVYHHLALQRNRRRHLW